MIAVGWRIKCFWGRFSDANSPHIHTHSLTDSTFPAQNRQEFEFPLLLSLSQRHFLCMYTVRLLLACFGSVPACKFSTDTCNGKGSQSERAFPAVKVADWLQDKSAMTACNHSEQQMPVHRKQQQYRRFTPTNECTCLLPRCSLR